MAKVSFTQALKFDPEDIMAIKGMETIQKNGKKKRNKPKIERLRRRQNLRVVVCLACSVARRSKVV